MRGAGWQRARNVRQAEAWRRPAVHRARARREVAASRSFTRAVAPAGPRARSAHGHGTTSPRRRAPGRAQAPRPSHPFSLVKSRDACGVIANSSSERPHLPATSWHFAFRGGRPRRRRQRRRRLLSSPPPKKFRTIGCCAGSSWRGAPASCIVNGCAFAALDLYENVYALRSLCKAREQPTKQAKRLKARGNWHVL